MSDRLKALALKLKQAQTEHAVEHAAAEKKKAEKRKQKAAKPKPKPKPRNRLHGQVNSTDVREWFVDGVTVCYGQPMVIGPWGPKERTLAKRMLKEYGEDLTRKAVKYFTENWKQIASKCKFKGLPTVNLLWGMRDTIFGEVQLGKQTFVSGRQEKMNSDEFDSAKAEEVADVGWD